MLRVPVCPRYSALLVGGSKFDAGRGEAGGGLVDLKDDECDTGLSLFRFFVRWATDNAGSLATLEDTLGSAIFRAGHERVPCACALRTRSGNINTLNFGHA